MRGILFSAVLIASAGTAMAAEKVIVTGDKLRESLSGKTVYLMTPIGSEIPIRYKANGTIHGSISATLAALGGEGRRTDTGRWWVVREQVCQQWKNWSDRRSHCYKFSIADGNVHWQRSDGETGSGRISPN